MKQPTISNLQFTIINDCITTLCQSPRTLTKSIIPTPPIAPIVPTLHHSHSSHSSHHSHNPHHSHRSHPSHSLPVRLAPPTAPTIPIPSTTLFRLVPLRGFGGSRHSSFVSRHSSLVIRLSSFVSRHSSLVIRLSSFVSRHSSLVIRHSSFVTRHSSLVIRHSSFVTRHLSLGNFQSFSENSIDYTDIQ